MLNGSSCPARLTRAKTAFAETLARSPLTAQVIDPPACFSDMMQLLQMVRRNRRMWAFKPVDGQRINPFHDVVGAPTGTHRLADFWAEHAGLA
ncbi:hypothetical protein [Buchananella hordeovulneris]|uniref:hypothetical protein n=1 Tax=Buchananella hordeovulneris TaxID=52770 RepID=UPI0026DCE7AB|nr:hypothetical protein [Buchananella hordeovulneris]MDO5081136.1 hypothetical protein [Buchananella hordeovulneris]